VEVSGHNNAVLIRDSTQPESAYICVTKEDFGGFVVAVKAGKFDLAKRLSAR
jgi:hypothetical protein